MSARNARITAEEQKKKKVGMGLPFVTFHLGHVFVFLYQGHWIVVVHLASDFNPPHLALSSSSSSLLFLSFPFDTSAYIRHWVE
jgi:hypothetical protein